MRKAERILSVCSYYIFIIALLGVFLAGSHLRISEWHMYIDLFNKNTHVILGEQSEKCSYIALLSVVCLDFENCTVFMFQTIA